MVDFQGKIGAGRMACKSLHHSFGKVYETSYKYCRTNLAGGGP